MYIIKNKEHLNPDRKGLDKILQLKKGMNAVISKDQGEIGDEEIRS